jgi:hypothetical protein
VEILPQRPTVPSLAIDVKTVDDLDAEHAVLSQLGGAGATGRSHISQGPAGQAPTPSISDEPIDRAAFQADTSPNGELF